jgi:hypothetical protein
MGATRRAAIRVLALATTLAVPMVVGADVAAAAPGHTSCRSLGQTNASEAQAHVLASEILAFAPGSVDDLVALVQLGGTFDGEVVEPLCTPK